MIPINASEAGPRACSVCGRPRGNSRTGWTPVTHGEAVIGFVCSECPTPSEPIRRIVTKTGVRFRAVVDATPPGSQQRKQATRTLPSLPAARAWVAEVRETISREGGYVRAGDAVTVSELADRWLSTRLGVRQVTIDGYRSALRPVLVHIGTRKVSDVRRSDVQAMLAWMLREGGVRGRALSPRSVQLGYVAFAQMLDLAVGDGIVPLNVARQVKRSELPRQAARVGRSLQHWTPDQLVRFRQQADLDPLAGLMRLSLSGLSRADICGLAWSDLDLDRGTATIERGRVALRDGTTVIEPPKSQQRRRVVPFESMWPGSVGLLRQLRASQAADRLAAGAAWSDSGGLVYVDAIGRPIRPEAYSDAFRRIAAAAELPPIRLHSLRHSIAFWVHSLGVPPADGAALLGHRLDVHMSVYVPEGGVTGAAHAAEVMGRAVAAAG